MQKLRLPINDFKPTAGYKNSNYKTKFGFIHYGIDCISKSGKTALYGLGEGTVIASGLDGIKGATMGVNSGCGYVLIIKYTDVYNWFTKEHYDVICTYFHLMKQPNVKVGQKVTKSTLLGYYGNTGYKTTGMHLHIQFDSDCKYPYNCAGIGSSGHSILKKGVVDSSINPIQLLHRDDDQSISLTSSSYYNSSDFDKIPKINNGYYVGTKTEIFKEFKTKSEAEVYYNGVKVYEKG